MGTTGHSFIHNLERRKIIAIGRFLIERFKYYELLFEAMPTRGYFFTWDELCRYFPEKRISELRFKILELHRSGWTRKALMNEFKMSESTLDATLKRYKDAKCVEDCMDKSRAPKNPNRNFSVQTKQKLEEIRQKEKAKAEKDCAKWIEEMKASGAKLSNAKIEKQKERIKKSVPGIRKIAAKYNFEAEREGRPKIGKSWAAELLKSNILKGFKGLREK